MTGLLKVFVTTVCLYVSWCLFFRESMEGADIWIACDWDNVMESSLQGLSWGLGTAHLELHSGTWSGW